jgi:hypothetical protein
VTEIAASAQQDEIAHIAERGGRIVEEVREARVTGRDEPPQHPRHDERPDHVTRPDMHAEKVVLGEVGDGEAGDKRPMKDPHERIPHIDLRRIQTSISIEHGTFLSPLTALSLEQNQGGQLLFGSLKTPLLTLTLAGKI